MLRVQIFIISITLILGACQKSTSSDRPFYLGGIAIQEEHIDDWVNTFKWVGMNTVEVTVYAKQWEWYWDSLEHEDYEDTGVLGEIRAAKKAGLNVVLVLRVQLQHWFPNNHFLWHGMIMPLTEEGVGCWFDNFEYYCLYWAKICAQENVDILCLGSELNALASTTPLKNVPGLYQYYNSIEAQENYEKRILKYEKELKKHQDWDTKFKGYLSLENYLDTKIQRQYQWAQSATFAGSNDQLSLLNKRRKFVKNRWSELIRNTRHLYRGKLTYAANFDNYQEVDFWEELDFIGINAYFPLRKVVNGPLIEGPIKQQFRNSWDNIFQEINAFQKVNHLTNKPLLFTELGYTNVLDCTIESWKGDGFSLAGENESEKLIIWKSQPKFPKERIWAVESLYDVVNTQKINLQGILYWKLTTHEYLLKEEPFALHFHQTSNDRLQDALLQFVK